VTQFAVHALQAGRDIRGRFRGRWRKRSAHYHRAWPTDRQLSHGGTKGFEPCLREDYGVDIVLIITRDGAPLLKQVLEIPEAVGEISSRLVVTAVLDHERIWLRVRTPYLFGRKRLDKEASAIIPTRRVSNLSHFRHFGMSFKTKNGRLE
jgi:hypothetical protein